jgi:hypothetical protein
MTEIKTWHERAMEHPDHQTGMVSEAMIRARMCEEIEELRAEIVRLRARVKVLEKHLALVIVNEETGSYESTGLAIERARAALEAKP